MEVNVNESEITQSKRGYLNEDFKIYHLKDQKNMEFEFHYHDFNKINIIISGNATYLIEGKTYKLRPWDILFINSNEIHRVIVNSDEPYERIIIWINSSFLDKHNINNDNLLTCFHLAQEHRNNLLRLNSDRINSLKYLLNQIEETDKSREFGSGILKNALFIEFLVYINRMFILKDRREIGDIDYDENINRILDYINTNLSENLSIEAIADAFYISKYYLMHRFKAVTGYTIHNYIIKKRLIMANALIKDGRTIVDVCSECGFEDYSNFLRAYKKMFGISPKKYYLETKKPY